MTASSSRAGGFGQPRRLLEPGVLADQQATDLRTPSPASNTQVPWPGVK